MLVRQRRAPLPLWGWGADLIRHPLGLLTIVPTGMSRGLQAAEPARTTSRTDLIVRYFVKGANRGTGAARWYGCQAAPAARVAAGRATRPASSAARPAREQARPAPAAARAAKTAAAAARSRWARLVRSPAVRGPEFFPAPGAGARGRRAGGEGARGRAAERIRPCGGSAPTSTRRRRRRPTPSGGGWRGPRGPGKRPRPAPVLPAGVPTSPPRAHRPAAAPPAGTAPD